MSDDAPWWARRIPSPPSSPAVEPGGSDAGSQPGAPVAPDVGDGLPPLPDELIASMRAQHGDDVQAFDAELAALRAKRRQNFEAWQAQAPGMLANVGLQAGRMLKNVDLQNAIGRENLGKPTVAALIAERQHDPAAAAEAIRQAHQKPPRRMTRREAAIWACPALLQPAAPGVPIQLYPNLGQRRLFPRAGPGRPSKLDGVDQYVRHHLRAWELVLRGMHHRLIRAPKGGSVPFRVERDSLI